jgi:hypothetical protein
MGHANSKAALRYQHATSDRDQAIAEALSGLAKRHQDDQAERAAPRTRDEGSEKRGRTRISGPQKGR